MISKDTISLVRERTNLVEVVSESVPTLKRRGRRFVGLCPFHQERTPSFHVNPDTNHFHCFGCQESGDAIAFLQRVEGYDFVEAVRALAERAGIPIAEEHGPPTDADRHKREREALYSALQMAATWYEEQLRLHPRRSFAIEELARRGLAPEDAAVQAFRVGYAPPEWDGLAAFLKKQGVSPAVGEAAGLIVPRAGPTGTAAAGQSKGGYYDRFRHRLMFAVMDRRGHVIAFSGRALPAASEEEASRDPPPKYINSPESPVYLKKANLFGLWQARNAIRKEERAVLVEGNFDVVSLHARGVSHVVAPLGTAFTEEQADLLRKHYAGAVTLLFDGDAAGRKAARTAEKACEVAGLDAKVATLPDGVDPDELVRVKGVEALRHVLAQARGLLEYLIDVELDETFNAADSAEKAARVERIRAILDRQREPVVRGMLKAYADQAAGRIDLVRSAPNAFAVLERTFRGSIRVVVGPRPSEARIRARPPGQEERKAIVEALLDFPVLLDDSEVMAALELLEGESARIVAMMRRAIRPNSRGEKVLDSAEFLAQMLPAIQAFASARLAAPAHDTIDDARATIRVNAKKLREINVARETSEIVREQGRVGSDFGAQVELVKHADAIQRQRQGLSRR